MAVESVAGPLGELRGGTATGVALSTTAAYIPIPAGARHLFLTPRNFSTAVVARVLLNPYIVVLKTEDALATNPTDYSEAAQDGDTATDVVLSSLPTLANGGAVYVGSHLPFGGLSVDVDSTNSTSSTLAVTYWNGSAWANITPTDGTASGGATFAQDGNITWTVPTAWVPEKLHIAADAAASFPFGGNKFYWVRLAVSAALDSSTTLNSIMPINRSTAYASLASGQDLELRITRGPEGVGSIQAVTDAGTGNLVVNYATSVGTGY